MFALEEINKLSKTKQALLETCYYAIKYADEKKIETIKKEHYSTDNWLEESVSPQYPTLTIKSDGLSTDLYINNKDCINETLDL